MVSDTQTSPDLSCYVISSESWHTDIARKHVNDLSEDSIKYISSGYIYNHILGVKYNMWCLINLYLPLLFMKQLNSNVILQLHPFNLSQISTPFGRL